MSRVEEHIVVKLKESQQTISTMESCTSGLLISTITDVEGASAITHGGFVTYSNEQKIRMGVSADIIHKYGVYSKEVAEEMAKVSMKRTGADIGIGVTGTFGNLDPNNADSQKGVVFACIVIRRLGKIQIYPKKILVPIERLKKKKGDKTARFYEKEYVVTHILNELHRVL